MKKIVLIFASILLFSVMSFAQKIEFTKKVHNFGTLYEEGGPVTYKYEFKNTGPVPLIIFKVEASCGCTTPEWTKRPIAPGKKGFLMVEFNPYENLGNVSKTVTINSNAENPTVKLIVKANVVKGDKTNKTTTTSSK